MDPECSVTENRLEVLCCLRSGADPIITNDTLAIAEATIAEATIAEATAQTATQGRGARTARATWPARTSWRATRRARPARTTGWSTRSTRIARTSRITWASLARAAPSVAAQKASMKTCLEAAGNSRTVRPSVESTSSLPVFAAT